MKKVLGFLLTMLLFHSVTSADKPLVSSTIDFLDYVFLYKGSEDHYPLAEYEQALRELAESGVKKIYLRVNVCGLTHYPTKVSALYGDDNALHWNAPAPAKRLAETYKHYDPCAETIRIGKKYGMEVWAWESVFDDAGVKYPRPGKGTDPAWQEAWRKRDGWALIDPFYLDNMDAFAMRDPSKAMPQSEIDEIDRKAAEYPVEKIVFTNTPARAGMPPVRFTPADVSIYTSSDNAAYHRYTRPYTVKISETSDRRNRLEISGLSITDPYVKIAHKGMPKDNKFSFVLSSERGQCEVYNSRGELIPTVWGATTGSNPVPTGSALNFELRSDTAWDYMTRQVGFKVGEVAQNRYYYGMAEFNVPKAMEHKVARFAEIAEYPFDGFMFNTRCHSPVKNPEEYGFNPEVLEKFKARFGRKYRGGEADLAGLFQLRAEAIAEFFQRCRKIAGERPVYMSAPVPLELKSRSDYNPVFGPLPWLYQRYFADGSIDGVVMIGTNFRNGTGFADYFTPEITGGKPIKIGVFREMLNRPKDYDFAADLEQIRKAGLDEVELYESAVINCNPVLGEIIQGRVPADWSKDIPLKWE